MVGGISQGHVMDNKPARYDHEALHAYATKLLEAVGLAHERSEAVADSLVQSELLGHRTHGLAWMPTYLQRVQNGTIASSGEIDVIADHSGAFAWSAGRLPGSWVMRKAVAEMLGRGGPVVAATIANCSHIGALQIYLEAFTRKGLLVQIAATDASIRSVAPFGGIDPVTTTNPLAMGIPTDGDPILIDQCTSVISNAAVRPYLASGQRLPGKWLLDETGQATDDPEAISGGRTGTILPVGGTDFGYKGFGFGLMVEALSLALSGFGRHDKPETFTESVFILALDPAFFGGRENFVAETTELVAAIHKSRPVPGRGDMRFPGERALAVRREQLEQGLRVDPQAVQAMTQWGITLGVPMPANLSR
jgi:L-lactate dehydrogenase